MANMFSDKSEKQIPKTLSECIYPDATASNLHLWAERLEKWGKILFWILIVYGIITAIITSIAIKEVVHGTYYQWTETETSFDFILFVTSIAGTALYAFLEYCAYHVLALLISSLALITQNTVISANVALYEASQNCSDSNNSPTVAPHSSVFSNKKTDSYIQEIAQKPNPTSMWECKHCLTYNKSEHGQCKKCGKFRSE